MSVKRLCLSLLCAVFCATAASAQTTEVHAVGVYEGDVKTDGKVHGPEARITVERAGADVVLALGSNHAVRWLVSASPETQIREIYVHGRDASRAEVILNGEAFRPNALEIGVTYQNEGRDFRRLIDGLTQRLNVDSIASFHGAYTAPDQAFVLDQIQENPGNRADFLASQVDPEALTDVLRPFTFANFTPLARLEADGFYLTDGGVERHFPVTLDVPPISSRTGTVAYDPTRQILYGGSAWHTGFVYAYDIVNARWSAFEQPRGMIITGMVFDQVRDRVVVGGGALVSRMGLPAKLHALGQSNQFIAIKHDDLPGFKDLEDIGNGPSAQLVPLAIDGDLLLARAVALHGRTRGIESYRLYLINLESGAVALVGFQG